MVRFYCVTFIENSLSVVVYRILYISVMLVHTLSWRENFYTGKNWNKQNSFCLTILFLSIKYYLNIFSARQWFVGTTMFIETCTQIFISISIFFFLVKKKLFSIECCLVKIYRLLMRVFVYVCACVQIMQKCISVLFKRTGIFFVNNTIIEHI